MAVRRRRTVAIGIDQPTQDIVHQLKAVNRLAHVVVVGCKIRGIDSVPQTGSEQIAETLRTLLDTGAVDAVVRGQIHPRFLFLPLFRNMGMERSYLDGKGQVSALVFEHVRTKRFFVLSSAELSQGYDLEQKKFEALTIANFLKGYGIQPYVGIMTMRRGRPKNAKPIKGFRPNPIIDQTYLHAELLHAYLTQRRIRSDMFNIEYETAIEAGVNLIVPPLGAIGNAFARALTFFSENWEIVCASTLHFRPKIYQQCFKTGKGKMFYNLILAAAAEADRSQRQRK